MISQASIETAYCFLHQKLKVFEHSTLDWQKDDIEYAIDSYVATMPKELYQLLASGQNDFLRDHSRFETDMKSAVEQLEKLLHI